jgi:hypothetical protein
MKPYKLLLTSLFTVVALSVGAQSAATPFTIVLIPDSQYMSDTGTSGSNLWYQTCGWISSQVTNLNIKAVLGLGDITDDNSTNAYITMQAGFNLLTNQIPVLPCVGNHDGVNEGDLTYANFNSMFTRSWITNQHGWNGGFYTNNASQNSYLVFTNAGITYICLTTEFGGGNTNIMMWCSNVCSSFPLNTSYCIFSTHAFLQMTGLRDQLGDPYDPPIGYGIGFSGEQLWGFWKQIPSLGLIVNGHFLQYPNGRPDQLPYEARRIDVGTAGNWINQLICNHQEQSPPDSYLKILTFYPGQNVIYASTADIGTTSTNYVAADAYTMPIRLLNLTITFVGPNGVVVSWPNTGSYMLQTNNNLNTTNWLGYGGTINTANGTNSVTITPPMGNLFFRLANP